MNAEVVVEADAIPGSLPDSSQELVARARSGETEAREELARRLVRPAYLLALQLLRDPEGARDIAQEGLLRFFTHLDRIDPQRPPRPWLFAIVRNLVRDRQRHRQRWRMREIEGTDAVELVDPAADAEVEAQRQELRRRVWRALASLPEKHREILVLRDYQDLTYAEIAQVLGVALGTVMSRLHRARRALRDRLEAQERERPQAAPTTGDG